MGDPSIFCRIVKGALRFYTLPVGKARGARRFPLQKCPDGQNTPPLRRRLFELARRACFFHRDRI
ncbi:hypothetical protein HMPREF0372_03504 [Flavonifractor plautii ATCC 29863]|uniref:Uncharacterized protein n=1 Tax=Flavonifractor plautii ATCC 29863 TaxID=411475 RepID=G9YVD8_FLAPL|nr:hypothetical protein HMPREF0372_03504 [Flavonifractor plautii ATCC 29863]